MQRTRMSGPAAPDALSKVIPQAAATTALSGNQARLRRLRAVIGPHAGALAAAEVSRVGDAEERAAVAAAHDPRSLAKRAATPVASPTSVLGSALGPGQALDASLLKELEAASGRDLSGVRVHTDARAGRIATAFGARAITVGSEIAFASEAYAPHATQGRGLIAHEIAHALSPSPTPKVFRDPAKETAADVDQRVLKGMIGLVSSQPADDEARLNALVDLFGSVPQEQIPHLYRRLDPGAPTDDFAQYFKNNFAQSRKLGLAFLRNNYAGTFPGTSAAVSNVEDNTAVAATTLAQLGLAFAGSMKGDGWKLNPKFWVVKYILKRKDASVEFVGEVGKPPPYRQCEDFRSKHSDWDVPDLVLDIEIRFGRFGESAALNDMWNPGSSGEYAFDCLNAAWMAQLRGVYLSYPAAKRDIDFDRDYKGYFTRFTPDDAKRSDPGDYQEIELPEKVTLAESAKLASLLKPGDEATISNPFMPNSSAFRNENVVYIADGKFMGHPFGVFTIDQYVTKLIAYLDASKSEAERRDYVLKTCFIKNISRPKAR